MRLLGAVHEESGEYVSNFLVWHFGVETPLKIGIKSDCQSLIIEKDI